MLWPFPGMEAEMTRNIKLESVITLLLIASLSRPQGPPIIPPTQSCTTIMAGKLATSDGSVITSHTCDANYRTWVTIVPSGEHKKGEKTRIYKGLLHNEFPGDMRGVEVAGEIPGVRKTYKYLNTAYPCMNEHQLAIGESTFGGKKVMRSRKGMFLIEELERIALERTRTAREAIRLIGRLAEEYGYIDAGEILSIADKNEVWHLEIVGPGKGRKGAVWAAVRIPDDHVGVGANISRIPEIYPSRKDMYMASSNVFSRAKELKLWDPEKDGPFKFWKAYGGKKPFGIREWWVFRQIAPSLEIDFFKAGELPFSVKPEKKLSVKDIFALLRSTYEGSEFDLCKHLAFKDPRTGRKKKIIHASPWLPWDLVRAFNNLKPGTIKFYRPIAVAFNAYNFVTQSRSWLPDAIGGICWLGFDNPATTPRGPIFAGTEDLPAPMKLDGQKKFSRKCAAWAFRRASRLASIKWGLTRKRMLEKILFYEEKALSELPFVEKKAMALYRKDPKEARKYLTGYTCSFFRSMIEDYWELGDELWSLYNWRL